MNKKHLKSNNLFYVIDHKELQKALHNPEASGMLQTFCEVSENLTQCPKVGLLQTKFPWYYH